MARGMSNRAGHVDGTLVIRHVSITTGMQATEMPATGDGTKMARPITGRAITGQTGTPNRRNASHQAMPSSLRSFLEYMKSGSLRPCLIQER